MSNIESHIPRQTLQGEVVARLRDEIIEGLWRPGVRLQERLLCQRYGISRSPLREAYQVLASEGLLELSPNKGAVVSTPTAALTRQNYTLLTALEALAINLACAAANDDEIDQILALNTEMKRSSKCNDTREFFRLNNEVHRRIVAASGNMPLIDAHQVVSRQIIRVQNLNGPLEHSVDESHAEHDAFLDALKMRDRRRAVSLLKGHLKTAEENLSTRLDALKD